jgi:hypothetical protein
LIRRIDLKPRSDHEVVLFLHIPKAGGTTLYKILGRNYSRAETLTLRGDQSQIARFKALPDAKRGQYRLIQGHWHFGLHHFIPRPSKYITFLRCPIERVFSFFYYARTTPDHYLYPRLTTDRLDLRTLLAREMTVELRNHQTRLLAGDEWKDPQRVVTDAALEQAKAHLRTHFRVVGLLEEFDASLLLLSRAFGWDLPLYVKKNVTKKKPAETSLDAGTRKLIENANSLDIELYEYARSLFQEQRRLAGDAFDAELSYFRQLNCTYERLGKFHAHSLARLVSWFPMARRKKLHLE